MLAAFRAIAQLLPDALLLVSRSGAVVVANDAAGERLGVPVTAVEGRALVELTGDPALAEFVSRCLRSTGPLPGAFTLAGRGERVRCEGARLSGPDALLVLRLVAPEQHGHFALLSEKVDALNREALHRRTAEAQRERLIAELNRAVRLSETFVAVLGHDLRNPLGAVVAGATLALRRTEDPKVRGHLERVLRSARRMARMVEQLLDVSRVRLGRGIPLTRAEIDLSELVRQAAAETEPSHRQHRFDLRLPARCEGEWDRDRLAQVLSNLLANACEHSEAGSVVTVTLRDAPAQASVSVHNPGPAIPPELLPSVFDAFASGAEGRGLGLGLHIAREIAQAHGGDVAVESAPERGTTFTVTLPRRAAGAAARTMTPLPQLLDAAPTPGRAGGTR
ncbi:sensor histidine kinase [Anaeromyxobacter terrae]|uniref:sensor histidine kinase n=1 Tax=Anaeromyxobacter terrae TaxID=2925406 RepID=UPI001F5AF140|nr:PAS domain-containing sensor histidine kinase [Anaeromyxobacter sp. SG22]